MSCSHLWLVNASATVRFFKTLRVTAASSDGANTEIEHPCIHRSDQNKVLFPLPISVTTEISNNARTFAWTGTSRPFHGRSVWVFVNQSHLIWSAHPMTSRFGMPSPPRSIALWRMVDKHDWNYLRSLVSLISIILNMFSYWTLFFCWRNILDSVTVFPLTCVTVLQLSTLIRILFLPTPLIHYQNDTHIYENFFYLSGSTRRIGVGMYQFFMYGLSRVE